MLTTLTIPALNLKYRHELKYLVNYHQYFMIRQRLKHLMQPDQHAGSTGEYHIRSLYFDDINNKALAEKQGGLPHRTKYRIRIYNMEDRLIHLEKKIKNNDYVTKLKETLTRPVADQIIAGNYNALQHSSKPLFLDLYDKMKNHLLRPKVLVDYTREPYVCHNGNVRITFDKQLRSGIHATSLFDRELATVPALDENHMILEVKYDEYLPEYIRNGLQLEGVHRQAASKYIICRKFIKYNSWEDQ